MASESDILRPGDTTGKIKDIEIPTQDEEKLKRWFIGSIDQGTTSTRFLIFDGTGTPIASHQMEFKQMYPYPGSVFLQAHSSDSAITIDTFAGG